LGVISFGHHFDVSLLQPFQRWFFAKWHNVRSGQKIVYVIFVVLFDEFDHFGQTLDSLYEGCKDSSFGDRTLNQNFWLKLANSFVFYGVLNVFNIIYVLRILN
jgi:hypothetical protein